LQAVAAAAQLAKQHSSKLTVLVVEKLGHTDAEKQLETLRWCAGLLLNNAA
jgi:predicted phosphoribosyltransferase